MVGSIKPFILPSIRVEETEKMSQIAKKDAFENMGNGSMSTVRRDLVAYMIVEEIIVSTTILWMLKYKRINKSCTYLYIVWVKVYPVV
jgi:hypothetical protein